MRPHRHIPPMRTLSRNDCALCGELSRRSSELIFWKTEVDSHAQLQDIRLVFHHVQVS